MFSAYSSTQPSASDLYREMFAIHGLPIPRPAVQKPRGAVTLEDHTPASTPTQVLYRRMFTTHGIPDPHPAVQQPEGMITLESNAAATQTSARGLYRQMFAAHGMRPPIAFRGSTPTPSSTPDLYREMFEAHANVPGISEPAASLHASLHAVAKPAFLQVQPRARLRC